MLHLQTRTIFAETNFAYDNLFWENFNTILPKGQLNDAINKITSKIEETGKMKYNIPRLGYWLKFE
ncbi:hypothetical protein AGMMS49574_06670 [Bacteroidia bacterium]|nr:hypothetical protein AGMMS49574_06670 [Bacteroidia bacterium]